MSIVSILVLSEHEWNPLVGFCLLSRFSGIYIIPSPLDHVLASASETFHVYIALLVGYKRLRLPEVSDNILKMIQKSVSSTHVICSFMFIP